MFSDKNGKTCHLSKRQTDSVFTLTLKDMADKLVNILV